MPRMIVLICNWWNLFVRLLIPHKHHEAITSRPLLLSSIGRLTEHGRQKKMIISSTHDDITTLKSAYIRLVDFFDELKTTATQLNYNECWSFILPKAMEKFKVNLGSDNYVGLPAPS